MILNTNYGYINDEFLPFLFEEIVIKNYSLNFIYLEVDHLSYDVNTNKLKGSFVFPNETYTNFFPRTKCLNAPEASILAFQMSLLSACANLYQHSHLFKKPFFCHNMLPKEIKKQVKKTINNIVVKDMNFSFCKPLYDNENSANRCDIKMDGIQITSKGPRIEYSGFIGNNKEFKFLITLFVIDEDIHS